MKAILLAALTLGGIWLGGEKLFNLYVEHRDLKPWFTGTEMVRACKMPYQNHSECYKLNATSDGNGFTTIHFNNGGYLKGETTECSKAGSVETVDRFCRFTDSKNDQWEILPLYDRNMS